MKAVLIRVSKEANSTKSVRTYFDDGQLLEVFHSGRKRDEFWSMHWFNRGDVAQLRRDYERWGWTIEETCTRSEHKGGSMNNLVLNFGHMLGDRSVKFLHQKLGTFTYIHHPLKIHFEKPILEQVVKAVDGVERRYEGVLESSVIHVITPGLTDPAVLLIVEILGRTGVLPHLLLMRRDSSDYVIYASLDCQNARLQARGRRKSQTRLEA